jgi:hypothetical protein
MVFCAFMNTPSRALLAAALVVLFAVAAQADIITYEITQHTATTLKSLGNKFFLGCLVIAVAIVATAVIKRKN